MPAAWKKWEGQVVDGKFPLRQYLGASESSAVFLTEHTAQGLPKAAIKLLATDPARAEAQLARWKQAAQLSHPHLLRIFDAGRCRLENTEMLYLLMEYAEENLAEIIPQRALTTTEALEMLKPTLDALSSLHSRGFVHGHIKPANILANGDQLKLSSDGLVRVGELRPGVGPAGVYGAPESAGGRASTAQDAWSLGITLVEILTQRLPVWAPADAGDPIVPKTLEAPFLEIARNCLRRDVQNRWTIAQIAARLQPSAPASAPRQTPPPARAPKPSLLPRYAVPALAVVLVVVAVLAVPRLVNHPPEAPPASSAVPAETPAATSAQKTPPPAAASLPSKAQSSLAQKSATPQPQDAKLTTNSDRNLPAAAAPSNASLRSESPAGTPARSRVPGEVLQRILPEVSQKARDTIQGTLRISVKVSVDSAGNVVDAALDSRARSKYFSDAALKAARHWEFVPPKLDGQRAASTWMLRFDFTKTDTRAFAAVATP